MTFLNVFRWYEKGTLGQSGLKINLCNQFFSNVTVFYQLKTSENQKGFEKNWEEMD